MGIMTSKGSLDTHRSSVGWRWGVPDSRTMADSGNPGLCDLRHVLEHDTSIMYIIVFWHKLKTTHVCSITPLYMFINYYELLINVYYLLINVH